MSGLFIALAVIAGFILGVRVGLALGHRNERKRRPSAAKGRAAADVPERSEGGRR